VLGNWLNKKKKKKEKKQKKTKKRERENGNPGAKQLTAQQRVKTPTILP